MQKKLTITISEDVYKGLHSKIGAGKISRFIDSLARPHVIDDALDQEYAAMAKDHNREQTAGEWTENLTEDHSHETW